MRPVLLAAALVAATLPIGGCATLAAVGPSRADVATMRAGGAYDRVRSTAQELLPFLPGEIAGRVRAGLAIGDAAIAITRRGSTPAQRERALHQLAGGVAAILAALAAR